MGFITSKIEYLLLERNIYDSLSPLVFICRENKEYDLFLEEIFETFSDLKKLYSSIGTLANLFRFHPSEELTPTFIPTSQQESLRIFFNSWNRLSLKNIPFEKWSDLAEEGIKLLKDLIEENKLENYKNDPRYRDFMKRFIQRHEELRLSGEYPDLNELMDD
jgi:hypothetical protein